MNAVEMDAVEMDAVEMDHGREKSVTLSRATALLVPHWFAEYSTWSKYSAARVPPKGVFGKLFYSSIKQRYNSVLGLPVAGVTSRCFLFWAGLMIFVDSIFTAFFIPWFVAFGNTKRLVDVVILLSLSCLYMLDVLASFHRGFVIIWHGRKKEVCDGLHVARQYVLHGTFFVDMLASLPIVTVFTVPTSSVHAASLIRLTRLVRVFLWVFRSFTLPMTSSTPQVLRVIYVSSIIAVTVIYVTLVTLNLFGCLWIWVAYRDLDGSWLVDVAGQNYVDASWFTQYMLAVYFVVTTFTTVGYGDITASSTGERFAAILYMFVGTVVFGFLVGVFTNLLAPKQGSTTQHLQLYKNKMETVGAFIRDYSLDTERGIALHKYYQQHWLHAQVAEHQNCIVNELPPGLRCNIVRFLLSSTLPQLPAFSLLPIDAQEMLLSYVIFAPSPAMHDIHFQGDEVEHVFIIEEGEVSLLRYATPMLMVRGPSWMIEKSVFDCKGRDADSVGSVNPTHCYTARSISNCSVWMVPLKVMQLVFEACPIFYDALLPLAVSHPPASMFAGRTEATCTRAPNSEVLKHAMGIVQKANSLQTEQNHIEEMA